ncbi:MAG TPA: transposase [Acetobacteraceae bacterium]|nr:transposase [Acetobacteraceae bacterium]
MYIEAVPNRNSPPAILLRESYREGGKVRKCNLSDWPAAHIEGLRGVLKGGTVITAERDAFTVIRSLPHGHVVAALGTARKIGLDRILGPDGNRDRDLVLALLVGRILEPTAKLAAARRCRPPPPPPASARFSASATSTRTNSTPRWTGCCSANPPSRRRWRNAISATARWCSTTSRRATWKDAAARSPCTATIGTGKRGKLQITYGLLCAPDGCPVAIEVFEGNTADPMTLATQVDKLKQRFHLDHVVLVGDRGMITQARITEDIKAAGLDWITSLRAPAIKELLQGGALQLSPFDQRDMASITAPDFPGERLVVCRNPDLARERTRKREDLLAATERDLARVKAAVERKRNPLRGTAEIALAVGEVIDKHKMAKHFDLDIADASFNFARKTAEIAAEAATDGIYVVRTDDAEVV